MDEIPAQNQTVEGANEDKTSGVVANQEVSIVDLVQPDEKAADEFEVISKETSQGALAN